MLRIQTPLFGNSRLVRTVMTVAVAAALSACGGGSDSSGSSGTGSSGTGSSGGGTGSGTGTTSTTPRWTAVATASAAPTAPTAALPAPPTVTVVPNDPLFASQLQYGAAPASGAVGTETANIAAAWTVTTGAAHNIVVAVVDTGVDATHPDLIGRVLPGYNFRADPARNTDTTPHGPVSCAAGGLYEPWHGTAVAGTIAANGNNAIGGAGIHWGAKILPVRISDGCTGSGADLADAIRWSAGLTLLGVPANTTPAKIINLSVAAAGVCPAYMQSAIDDAIASGAIVIAGAGNSNGAVYFPANCRGVIGVGHTGVGAYGPELAVTANSGMFNVPYPNSVYTSFGGTSSATASTAGVVALVLSISPNLTAAGMRSVLTESSRAFVRFPSMTGVNGAGYLDAWRAIKYVQSMLLAQIGTAAVASNGSAMTLSSTSIATGTGASITSYSWSQASGPAATLTGATTANAGVVFPAGAGTYVFKLVVTDSLGRSSTAVQTVVVGG
jgi:serine protease